MSFGGSRVRPAGSRKSILEPGGEGGGARRAFSLFSGTGREDSHLLKN